MFSFNRRYFMVALLLLLVEILIALYVNDRFIRPYIGDTLVVILIYCFIKSFFKTSVLPTALAVLAFSFIVETLQYFKLVKLLGLQHNEIARIVIGTSFAWEDLLAYTFGIAIVLLTERWNGRLTASR